jgi:hypothetical protein
MFARSRRLSYRRVLLVAVAAVCAVVVARTAQAPAAVQIPEKCAGVWRWPVKTLADKPKLKIKKADVQVAQLWGLQPSETLNKTKPRIAGLETTIYTLTATLLYARRVDDKADKRPCRLRRFDPRR